MLTLAGNLCAANLAIDSLVGPVTQNEINSFVTFMQAQTPPQTPWGALGGTNGDHNEWADGTGGREMEAMGEMFEVSGNLTILNLMISWADDCVSQRNDLMSATNGGQRVMWTGRIDEVWCPNEPTSANAAYAGCENEDTEGHLAFCAKLILQNPSLWYATVPDSNPYGYGVTYLQRATNYLARCDQANAEYSLKWFIQPETSLIVAPTNAAWVAFDENVNAINRQMMFTSGFQRLAEAHAILGDNPDLAAQYDALVATNVTVCLNGMIGFDPHTANGQAVYDWGYYPTNDAPEATEIHAEYDMIGIYRAFNRANYGLALSPLVPFANTMVNVVYLGANTFAGDVSGGSGLQSPIYSGWLLPADWNPAVYAVVAGAAYTNGWYASSADIDAAILWMKNRRYLEFSVTPTPAFQVVPAGTGTMFTLAVAPLGGFTNVVNVALTGLPAGVTGRLSAAAIDLAALNYASTNVTLTLSTSNALPAGSYPLSIIGTSGMVSNATTVSLVIGSCALSAGPPTQTVSAGASVSYTVTVTTNTSFSGTVSLGVSGLPANANASFSPVSLNGAGDSTLNVTTAGATPAGSSTLTITITNGTVAASATVSLVVAGATPVWTGGSATDSNWSDPTNWGGISLVSGDTLIFSGTTRLNNTNSTAAATTYSNLVFNPGAGAFFLNGNPMVLAGNLTNNSASPQTLNLGLSFSNNPVFSGTSNLLILNGGLTNTFGAPGATTLTLAGTGQLANLLNSTQGPGGTNVIALNGPASWTLVDNASETPMTVPWVLTVNAGTFNFGSAGSAPRLTLTTPNNTPQDNLAGTVSGATGTFNLLNGSLTTASRLDTATALNSTGIVNQAGGTLNLGSQFQGANGAYAGEVSIVNLGGGTMSIGGGSGPFYVASRGTGTLNLTNGTLDCGTLDVSRNANGNSVGSVGVVNLAGGTMLCSHVGTATANAQTNWLNGSAATFNFNGGILKLNSSSTPFFQGSTVAPIIPISAVVKVGGAVIDSNGKTNLFAEPLLHDGALGAIPDGGLTKNGAGCLILESNVSYTGPTTVNAGSLALSNAVALNASPVLTVAAGAILDASGRADGTLTLTNGQTLTGTGAVKGNVVIGAGATLMPGAALGTLAFSNNLMLNGGSITVLAINKAVTPSNAVAQVTGSLACGGMLTVTNIGANTLVASDGFQVFKASGYAGNFTTVTLPPLAAGLTWNTNNLNVTGTISVSTITCTLTYLAGANGTISGSDSQTVNYGANGTAVTAVPGAGFYFVNWSDGSVANPRTESSVTNNLAVTANFVALVPPAINGGVLLAGGGFQLSFSGTNGQRWKILSSTNLTLAWANWSVITTGTFAGAVVNYTNPAHASPQRFYRITSP